MSNIHLVIPALGDKFVDYRQPIWGDSFTWSWERKLSEIKYLVIHHSVTSHDATPDDIALLHKARGWAGIGYHYVITKDGRVWYVGDLGTARANVKNKNELVVGICLVGDFTKHLPSDEQITSAHHLCQGLIDRIPQLPGWDAVVAHKDLQATQCPGSSWNGEPGGMKDRIEKNIPYTPPAIIKEVYKIVFKGNTIEEFEDNPLDKIKDLNDKLADTKDLNAKYVTKNADLEHDNTELLEENRVLNGTISQTRIQRDTALSDVRDLEKEVEGLVAANLILETKLATKDPLKTYSGKELIKAGLKKWFHR